MIFSASQVSFTKAELRALVAHSSADLTRAHISAVFFNGPQRAAVATDGHRLAVCEGEGESGEWSYLVPRETAETALRVSKAETFILTPSSADIGAFSKANKKIATIPAEHAQTGDGKPAVFPPYQQIMREPSKTGVAQGVDIDYVADVRLVADAVPDATRGAVFHPAAGSDDPVIVRVGPWTVMIMPRTDTEKHAGKSRLVRDVVADAAALATVSNGLVSAASEVPSAALVLATRVTAPLAPSTPQKGKRGPAIVLHATPVNAASLGSDAKPIALLGAKKSRERAWREAHASTADNVQRATLDAWVEDAAPVDGPNLSRPPWG